LKFQALTRLRPGLQDALDLLTQPRLVLSSSPLVRKELPLSGEFLFQLVVAVLELLKALADRRRVSIGRRCREAEVPSSAELRHQVPKRRRDIPTEGLVGRRVIPRVPRKQDLLRSLRRLFRLQPIRARRQRLQKPQVPELPASRSFVARRRAKAPRSRLDRPKEGLHDRVMPLHRRYQISRGRNAFSARGIDRKPSKAGS